MAAEAWDTFQKIVINAQDTFEAEVARARGVLREVVDQARRDYEAVVDELRPEMGTKVRDAPTVAGVECPKKTGEMDDEESCRACDYYSLCWGVIKGVLEADGR